MEKSDRKRQIPYVESKKQNKQSKTKNEAYGHREKNAGCQMGEVRYGQKE